MKTFKIMMKNINAGLPKARLQDGDTYRAVVRGTDFSTVTRHVAREQLDGCGLSVDSASSAYSDGSIIYRATYGKSLYGRVLVHIEEISPAE